MSSVNNPVRDTWAQTERRVRIALENAGIKASVRMDKWVNGQSYLRVDVEGAGALAISYLEQALGRGFGVHCDLGEHLRNTAKSVPIIVHRPDEATS